MTYRTMTPAELARRAELILAVEQAKRSLDDWQCANALERSSLKPGDEAYNLKTGTFVGCIHELIGGCYYSWQRHGCIDNNSRSYGAPELGTREEAAERMTLEARLMMSRARDLGLSEQAAPLAPEAPAAAISSGQREALVQGKCIYPDCNCPFDAPGEPGCCARGLQRSAGDGLNG